MSPSPEYENWRCSRSAWRRRAIDARSGTAKGRPTEDGSTAFACAHGYEQTASGEILVVDPRTIEAPALPDGVELRPFSAFEDDPSPIFRVDSVAMLDEPGEATLDALTYESWLDRFWRHPALDRDASMVVLVGGEAVTVTMLITERESGRGQNNGTGTLPEHRGRGLALLAKQASLARVAELGCTTVYTGNDATNAPMLAINRKLGYRLSSLEYAWGKTTTEEDPAAYQRTVSVVTSFGPDTRTIRQV